MFDNFFHEIQQQNLVINYVQIRQNDEIILDYSRLDSKTRLNTWSACKSIVSIGAGIAMDEGILNLNDKLCDSFPEYIPVNADKSLVELTVRDMLTMTTGLKDALFFTDDTIRYQTKDFISYFFAQDFPHPNHRRFLYSNFNTYMLACLIEKKAGCDFCEYLTPRLFEPLGILSPDWTRCPMGHVHAANGLYLTIDELADFGEMLLHNGTFRGKQIVSDRYIKEATQNQMPDTETEVHYGYQFWIDENNRHYRADGKFGQFCIVIPSKNAVIAIQSLESRPLMPMIEQEIISRL